MKKCAACKKKYDEAHLLEPWKSSGLCGPCAFEYIDDEASVAKDWVTRRDPASGIEAWLDQKRMAEDGDC